MPAPTTMTSQGPGGTRAVAPWKTRPAGAPSVPGIPGLVSVGPVPALRLEVGPRLAREVGGDVIGLLVGARGAAQRHLGLDEGPGRAEEGHAGADIKGARPPQRGENGVASRAHRPLPRDVVAGRAFRGVENP